jgi:hypothetical protein
MSIKLLSLITEAVVIANLVMANLGSFDYS